MIKIQEISSPGCGHCAAAKKVLEEEIKPQFSEVEVEYLDLFSDEGQKLVSEHGIMSSPGIIVNGELFSVGGLDKKKLIAKIKQLSGAREGL
ncbi:MAG: thioredoxin family protein [Candidatus Spechtbacterales bacterium]